MLFAFDCGDSTIRYDQEKEFCLNSDEWPPLDGTLKLQTCSNNASERLIYHWNTTTIRFEERSDLCMTVQDGLVAPGADIQIKECGDPPKRGQSFLRVPLLAPSDSWWHHPEIVAPAACGVAALLLLIWRFLRHRRPIRRFHGMREQLNSTRVHRRQRLPTFLSSLKDLPPAVAFPDDMFTLHRLLPKDSKFRALAQLLSDTDGSQLGRGRDVQQPGTYNKLQLRRAWRIQHNLLGQRYAVAKEQVRSDMVRLADPHSGINHFSAKKTVSQHVLIHPSLLSHLASAEVDTEVLCRSVDLGIPSGPRRWLIS